MMNVKDIIGCIFIAAGVALYILSVIGNYRFRNALSRMHAAGIGDSLALGLIVIGCVVINGFSVISLKLLIAVLCLYITSPVCTHMLAKLEADTNDKLEEECEVEEKCRS